MSSTREFERYLGLFRLRLKQLLLARGLSILAVSALVITVVAVFIAVRRGFPDEIVIAARVILLAAIVGIIYRLIVLPGRQTEEDGADDIEARAPGFAGRVRTWVGMQGRDHPLRDLLAEDSLLIAADHPPERQVPQKEFSALLSVAGVATVLLIYLAVAGPGNVGYGVRHLWFGWAMPGLLPPQSIAVLPGDDGIRLGGTVNVQATMQGFDPADAYVHARFGDGEWQQVGMAELAERFEFTFFSVREPLEYYVSAANVRSETITINVVDLPVIERLTLTYQ